MIPARPANPPLILLDTSVLIQVIASEQLQLLRCLRSEYDIQPTIVKAVESETIHLLTTNRKFMGRQESLRKAIANNTIRIVDRPLLDSLGGAGVEAILKQIDSEGQRLSLRVDRGEAYTHAASSILAAPVATNDFSAVRRLIRDNENVPRPVLRFWDLVVLGHQIERLDDVSCDMIRKCLVSLQESIPQCFSGKKYSAGLPEFYQRIVDGESPILGAPSRRENLDERRVIFRRLDG